LLVCFLKHSLLLVLWPFYFNAYTIIHHISFNKLSITFIYLASLHQNEAYYLTIQNLFTKYCFIFFILL